MHISFVNFRIRQPLYKGNDLVRISGMIIAKAAIYCVTPWDFQRGQTCIFINERVPQNSKPLVEFNKEDAMARATDFIEFSNVERRL